MSYDSTKVLKYAKKLVAKKEDPTLLTKEEFFRRVDEAREEIRQGKGIRMLPNESLDDFLRVHVDVLSAYGH